MAQVFGGVHFSVVLVHPLGAVQVGHVLFQVVHDLVYVVPLGHHRLRFLLVKMVF